MSWVGGRCTGGSRGQGWRPQSGKVAPSLPGRNPGLLLRLLRRHQSPRQPNRPPPGLNSPTLLPGPLPRGGNLGLERVPGAPAGRTDQVCARHLGCETPAPARAHVTPRSRLHRQNSTKVPTASSREPAHTHPHLRPPRRQPRLPLTAPSQGQTSIPHDPDGQAAASQRTMSPCPRPGVPPP